MAAREGSASRRMPGCCSSSSHHVPHRPVAPARHVDDGGEILAADRIHLGRRKRVEIHARVRVGDRPKEGQQQPDLGPGIEPGRTGEPPRDAGDVEGAQDRIGVTVRPDEDRVIARRRHPRRPGARCPRRSSRPPPIPWRTPRVAPRAGEGSRRSALRRLVRPVRTSSRSGSLNRTSRYAASRIGARRSVVAAEDDGPCIRVADTEPEDVVDRRTPERVDRLVVVADDRHVPVRLREQGDQLGLGAVRVLELVHEDVAEPAGDRAPGGR